MKSAKTTPYGFSLIEAAIVLALIGIVIGGIWVAAGAVLNQYKISRFNALFSTILREADRLCQPATCPATGISGDDLIAMQAIPAEFISPANTLATPWDSTTISYNFHPTIYANQITISIANTTVSQNTCRALLNATLASKKSYSIFFPESSSNYSSDPPTHLISPTDIISECAFDVRVDVTITR